MPLWHQQNGLLSTGAEVQQNYREEKEMWGVLSVSGQRVRKSNEIIWIYGGDVDSTAWDLRPALEPQVIKQSLPLL